MSPALRILRDLARSGLKSASNLIKTSWKLVIKVASVAWKFLTQQAGPIGSLGVIATIVFGIIAINMATDEAQGGTSDPAISASPSPSVSLAPRQGVLVSADADGAPADADSGRPSYGAGARYVVFTSTASNLAPNADGGYFNVYRKDLETGSVYLASEALSGAAPNGNSQYPVICSSGRYIAFASQATNLFALDSEAAPIWRIYLRDMISNQTVLVSSSSTGKQDGNFNPRFSADCRKLIFTALGDDLPTDSNGSADIYQYDLETAITSVVSLSGSSEQGDSWSSDADISPDGVYVTFSSPASNFPDAAPGRISVYLKNLKTGALTSVSRDFDIFASTDDGFGWPQFSADGRYIVIRSLVLDANNKRRSGHFVLVWSVEQSASALSAPGGAAIGWTDGCTTGTNNGTKFELSMSASSAEEPERVLFAVDSSNGCQLVLRDLFGTDVPIKPDPAGSEIIEPAMDAKGLHISWVTRPENGGNLQIYSCSISDCQVGNLVPTS